MEKLKFELGPCEYLEWTDNPSEMKRFCPECVITYETCAIADFWSLKIYDCITDTETTVPLNEKVIKLSEDNFCILPSILKYLGTITNV